MNKADELRLYVADSKHRLSYIGKCEEHLGDYGRLHGVVVKTVIGYQASPGARNYHEDEQFDKALAEVIKQQFNTLSALAILKMEEKANKALMEEEAYLVERLKKIQDMKNSS